MATGLAPAKAVEQGKGGPQQAAHPQIDLSKAAIHSHHKNHHHGPSAKEKLIHQINLQEFEDTLLGLNTYPRWRTLLNQFSRKNALNQPIPGLNEEEELSAKKTGRVSDQSKTGLLGPKDSENSENGAMVAGGAAGASRTSENLANDNLTAQQQTVDLIAEQNRAAAQHLDAQVQLQQQINILNQSASSKNMLEEIAKLDDVFLSQVLSVLVQRVRLKKASVIRAAKFYLQEAIAEGRIKSVPELLKLLNSDELADEMVIAALEELLKRRLTKEEVQDFLRSDQEKFFIENYE